MMRESFLPRLDSIFYPSETEELVFVSFVLKSIDSFLKEVRIIENIPLDDVRVKL